MSSLLTCCYTKCNFLWYSFILRHVAAIQLFSLLHSILVYHTIYVFIFHWRRTLIFYKFAIRMPLWPTYILHILHTCKISPGCMLLVLNHKWIHLQFYQYKHMRHMLRNLIVPHLRSHLVLSTFLLLPIWWLTYYVVVILTCIYLIIIELMYLFIYLLLTHILSSVKYLFRIFVLIFIWISYWFLIDFVILMVEIQFFILWTKPFVII